MKKRIMAVLLAFTLAAGTAVGPAGTVAVQAAEEDGQVTADGFHYEITGDSVTITGYDGSTAKVAIPDTIDGKTVTGIGYLCFEGRNDLHVVNIPSTVTDIGVRSFEGCGSLISVNIPEGVTSIKAGTFQGCSNLTNISIPSGVTSIDVTAFSNCGNLTNINIPSSVISIGGGAFFGCNSLRTVSYAGSREQWKQISIDDDNDRLKTAVITCSDGTEGGPQTPVKLVFEVSEYDDASVIITSYLGHDTEVVIPESLYGKTVVGIGSSAFSGCNSLKSVSIPSGVTSIESGAFSGCSRLNNINIPEGVTEIGDYAFQDCRELSSVVIPDSVTRIGSYAFQGCGKLGSVDMPDNTEIGGDAFDGTLWLENKLSTDSFWIQNHTLIAVDKELEGEIIIPETATSIKSRVFIGCDKVTSIRIPANMDTIENDYVFSYNIGGIFEGCSALTAITVDSRNQHFSSQDGLLYNYDKTRLLCCPPGKTGEVKILDSVTDLDGAFCGCDNIMTLKIPKGVTSTGYTNMAGVPLANGCANLTSVVFPEGMKTIGMFAMINCEKLSSITLPDSIETLSAIFGWMNNPNYCPNVKDIYYAGSQEQWEKIDMRLSDE